MTFYIAGVLHEIDKVTAANGIPAGPITVMLYDSGAVSETISAQVGEEGGVSGEGIVTYANGSRFVGELKDAVPNGQGTLRMADGETFEGFWSNGCFRQGNREAAAGTTLKDCGFAR